MSDKVVLKQTISVEHAGSNENDAENCDEQNEPRVETPEAFRRGHLVGRGAHQYDPSVFGLAADEQFQRGRRVIRGMSYENSREALAGLSVDEPQRHVYRPRPFHLCETPPDEMLLDVDAPQFDMSIGSNLSSLTNEMLGDVSAPSLRENTPHISINLSQEVVDELAGLAADVAASPTGAVGGTEFADTIYDELIDRFKNLKDRVENTHQLDTPQGTEKFTSTETSGNNCDRVQETVIESSIIGNDGKALCSTKRIVVVTDPSGNVSTKVNESKNTTPGTPKEGQHHVSQPSAFDSAFVSDLSYMSPMERLAQVRRNLQRRLNMYLPDLPIEELANISCRLVNDGSVDNISARSTPRRARSLPSRGESIDKVTPPSFDEVSMTPCRPMAHDYPSFRIDDMSMPSGGSGPSFQEECLDDMSMPSGISLLSPYSPSMQPGGDMSPQRSTRRSLNVPIERPKAVSTPRICPPPEPPRRVSLPRIYQATPHQRTQYRKRALNFDDTPEELLQTPKQICSPKGSPEPWSPPLIADCAPPHMTPTTPQSQCSPFNRANLTDSVQMSGEYTDDFMQFSEPCTPQSPLISGFEIPPRIYQRPGTGPCSPFNRAKITDSLQTSGEYTDEFMQFSEPCTPQSPLISGFATPPRTYHRPETGPCSPFNRPKSPTAQYARGDNLMQFNSFGGNVSADECLDELTLPSFDDCSMPDECLDEESMPSFGNVSMSPLRPLPDECLDQQSMPSFGNVSMTPRRPMGHDYPSFRLDDMSMPSGGSGPSFREECLDDMSMPSGMYGSPCPESSPSKQRSPRRSLSAPRERPHAASTPRICPPQESPKRASLPRAYQPTPLQRRQFRKRALNFNDTPDEFLESPQQIACPKPCRGRSLTPLLADCSSPSKESQRALTDDCFGAQSSPKRSCSLNRRQSPGSSRADDMPSSPAPLSPLLSDFGSPPKISPGAATGPCSPFNRADTPIAQYVRGDNLMQFNAFGGNVSADECLDEQTLPSFDDCSMGSPMPEECLNQQSMPSFANVSMTPHRPLPDECLDQQSMPSFRNVSMTPRRPMGHDYPSFRLDDMSMPSGGSGPSFREECLDDMSMPSGISGSPWPESSSSMQRRPRRSLSAPNKHQHAVSTPRICPPPESPRRASLPRTYQPTPRHRRQYRKRALNFNDTPEEFLESPQQICSPKGSPEPWSPPLIADCAPPHMTPTTPQSQCSPFNRANLTDSVQMSGEYTDDFMQFSEPCTPQSPLISGFEIPPRIYQRPGTGPCSPFNRAKITDSLQTSGEYTDEFMQFSEPCTPQSPLISGFATPPRTYHRPETGPCSPFNRPKSPTAQYARGDNLMQFNSFGGNVSADECLDELTLPSFDDCSMPDECLDEESMPSFGNVSMSPLRPLPDECLDQQSMPSFGNVSMTTRRPMGHDYPSFRLDDMSMPSGGSGPSFREECLDDMSMPSGIYGSPWPECSPSMQRSPRRSLSAPRERPQAASTPRICPPPESPKRASLPRAYQPTPLQRRHYRGRALDFANEPNKDGTPQPSDSCPIRMPTNSCPTQKNQVSFPSECIEDVMEFSPSEEPCTPPRGPLLPDCGSSPRFSQGSANGPCSPFNRTQSPIVQNECGDNLLQFSFGGNVSIDECLEDQTLPSFDDCSMPSPLPTECLAEESMPSYGNLSAYSPIVHNYPSFRIDDMSMPSGGSGPSFAEQCIDDMTMPSGGSSMYGSPWPDWTGGKSDNEIPSFERASIGTYGNMSVPMRGQALSQPTLDSRRTSLPGDLSASRESSQLGQLKRWTAQQLQNAGSYASIPSRQGSQHNIVESMHGEEYDVIRLPSFEHVNRRLPLPEDTPIRGEISSRDSSGSRARSSSGSPSRHAILQRISQHTAALLPDEQLEDISAPFLNDSNMTPVRGSKSVQSIHSLSRQAQDLSLPNDNLEDATPPSLLNQSTPRSSSGRRSGSIRRGLTPHLQDISPPSFVTTSPNLSNQSSYMRSPRLSTPSPVRNRSPPRGFDTMANYESFNESADSPIPAARQGSSRNAQCLRLPHQCPQGPNDRTPPPQCLLQGPQCPKHHPNCPRHAPTGPPRIIVRPPACAPIRPGTERTEICPPRRENLCPPRRENRCPPRRENPCPPRRDNSCPPRRENPCPPRRENAGPPRRENPGPPRRGLCPPRRNRPC